MTTPYRKSGRPAAWKGPAVVAVMSLLGLAACGSTSAEGGRPDWIDSRQHPQYPDGAYLIGVGTATDSSRDVADQQARDRAVADISGQLETHIRSTVTTYVQESMKMEGGETSSEMLSKVSSDVQASTRASLTSIRPVEQYYDAESGLGAALVVIKRSDYAMQAIESEAWASLIYTRILDVARQNSIGGLTAHVY